MATPLSELIPVEILPTERFTSEEPFPSVLERILITELDSRRLDPGPGDEITLGLTVDEDAVLSFPGLDGVALVLGGGTATVVEINAQVAPGDVEVRISGGIRLRFPREWLQPVVQQGGVWVNDSSRPFSEIGINADIIIDQDWTFTFDGPNEFVLGPSMIADTGFVIEGTLAIDLSANQSLPETLAMGLDDSWRGVVFKTLTLHLPSDLDVPILPEDLTLTNFHIGSGGLSGSVSGNWSPTVVGTQITGSGAGTLFGMPFGLKKIQLDLLQNAVIGIEIKGVLALPYFDHALDVELGLDLDGNIAITVDSDTGVSEFTLSSNSTEVMHVEVARLTVELFEGVLSVGVGGKITPKFGGLDWPTFDVQKLSIDADGNVHLDGGWLDLPAQYSLDFHGFQMEITKLGFGKTEDGGKWIGFSGGLKLVDGVRAGASVEGLRITWYDDGRDTKFTFNGVGVEFEVPEVLRFKGAVSYRELEVDAQTVHRFDGDIKLELLTLDMEVDATLVIGSASDPAGTYTFFAIHLGVELPAGIPLFSTGLALYGMAGLFALQMEPDKQSDEEWYGVGPTDGWYKRPAIGVTDLKQKWINRQDSLAFGAGITLGTVADNGYTFSGRMVLVIVFPGPILLIEGKANLLKERSKLDEEPIFRALAVLDNRAGSFLVGLDAQYKYGSGGELIDIHGGAEAFFNLDDASLWHLYLGEREPRAKRIRAEIFQLFEANSYFMLDPDQLALGAWVGYDKHWSFGPLSVTVQAWIEGNAVISWKPVYLHGDLWLHGKAELSVFGFGVGLSVDALFAADVFDPLHILAEFSVGINLPWPLPDFDADITLEWGPTLAPPPLPLPLKEIAVEHFKVSTSWPLPRNTLLLPDYDNNADGFLEAPSPPVTVQEAAPPPANAPIVPVDCRPHITFARAVHDEALVGVNPQPVLPTAQPPGWEWIGDPAQNEGPVRAYYGLREVALHKYVSGAWELIARKVGPGHPTPNPAGISELFGSWAPIPQLPIGDVTPGSDPPVANVKLWLWSKTPFDYTRHSGRAWDEWFTDQYTAYPCIPIPPDQEVCYDFESLALQSQLSAPWAHPDEPDLVLSWLAPGVQTVTILDKPVEGRARALCFPSVVSQPGGESKPNEITLDLPQPAKAVRIIAVDIEGVQVTGFDDAGTAFGPAFGGQPDNPNVIVEGDGITRVVVQGFVRPCLVAICLVVGPDADEINRREEMVQHLIDEMARWSQEGEVLEPHTTYRLKVVTTLETREFPHDASFNTVREQTEFAYFRTEGPPGLTELSTPIGHPNPDDFDSGLGDLTRYVQQTVPATVPAAGEKPPLPRPVYRAYDVGTAFNEDYVDLMYRLEQRDLGLYVYDNNNRPVRDAQGRLIVLSNRWGETEELTLTESAERWITVVNASDCATLDTTVIPHNKTLTSAAEGQVLDPDTVYEARLVPLLLHEDFSDYAVGTSVNGPSGALDRWAVHDAGVNDRPSHWEIREEGTPPSRHIVQTSNIWGGTQDREDPVKPGTLLLWANNPDLPGDHPEQPGSWTDYRLSVYLRSADDDAVGVVFRYRNANNYYRFSMDRQRKYRRLVRVINGIHTILAEDDFIYRQDQDYLITVEAIGASIRVNQDAAPIFDVIDGSIDHGRIGLYCWGNQNSRFSDVRVDDFRMAAPIVYRFKFTTSQFANFFHHLHSFQDETWPAVLTGDVLSDADLAALLAEAVAPSSVPSEAEARAYETLAGHILGAAARQSPPEVQLTRAERAGNSIAFLIQSPEPIDWQRTDLEVLRADSLVPRRQLPGSLKLTDATFGTTQPNEESVTLLLRDAIDLSGHRVEQRRLPGPVAETVDNPVLFVDEFDGAGGLLFQEAFGPNALDHYTIVDEGTNLGPSAWAVVSGHIVQNSEIFGGSVSEAVPDKPGTIALTGSAAWANVRISAGLRSTDDGAIGLVLRYRDADNYYRFSMDRERSYRRLVKKVGGTVTVLWEDDAAYNLAQSYRLVIEAYGDRLRGYLDDVLLFSVQDQAIGAGRVGFYCWANAGAHFESLSVEALEVQPVLWQPAFADLSEVEIVDEPEAIGGPSEWTVQDGVLAQSSNIHVEDDTPHQPGTYALGGSGEWENVEISVRLHSEAENAIGIMFRVLPQAGPSGEEQGHSYYRFSMDREGSYRRLVKKVGDTVTVLWEDTVQYTVGQTYDLTIRALGDELRGYLDGVLLFAVSDSDLERGRIGLYCAANTGARFGQVVVTDRTRRVGRWTIRDEGIVDAPSAWRLKGGALLQASNIYDGSLAGADPDKLGTYAIAGNPAWTDYRLTVRLHSDDDDAIGVIFRYVDDENYYRLSLDSQRSYRRLIRKENGTVSVLWQDTGGYTVGEPFTLTVDASGSRLVGYLENTRLFDLVDSSHAAGQVGLYCWGNTGARFERVEVRRPLPEAHALFRDRFANDDTAGWTVIDAQPQDGVTAEPSDWVTAAGAFHQRSNIWTPPDDRNTLSKKGTQAVAGDPTWTDVLVSARLQALDNDAIGLLFRYTDEDNYYRFSMDSQRGYRRLVKSVGGSFSPLWEDDFAYEVGRTYAITVVAVGSTLRGYLDGVPMFVVEDSDLSAGRIGLYCWANMDARFSQVRVYPANLVFSDWLLDESFDFLFSSRWTFVDEGDQDGPSQWEVAGGELRQTSDIAGGSTDGSVPDKPGTYALSGDPSWTDYRISVRLRSDDDDAIGVMFRYQDADNYCRFSMDRERSYRRLIKKVAGTVTVLWEDTVQYTLGREYVLTLDCVANRLTGYLDGVQLFRVEDSDLAAGRIGLYCWENTGARFAEVRVAAPAWMPYYTFQREERLPAGTQVRVYAGNAKDASSEQPNVVHHYVASLDERGRLHFPEDGVDLRLSAPGAGAGHTKRFLPDAEYSTVDVLVLRKADGTGFLLLPSPPGSTFTAGQYRLNLVYRRDNQASDPGSQVFSQAGVTNPEQVTLDIPWEMGS